MNRYVKAAGRGALAGTGATLAMTVFMKIARATGALGELPPRKIVKTSLRRAGVKPSDEVLAAATVAAHFAFGAAIGSAMAILRELGISQRTKRSAMKLASLVWSGAYRGAVPALGIMPRPKHDRPLRPVTMLGAHLIYGVVFDELVERI